jgi:hypothetical protein
VGGGVGVFAASNEKSIGACINKTTGVTRWRVNADSRKCTIQEDAVSWKVASGLSGVKLVADGGVSLPGAPGAPGAAGAKGDAGAPGAKGDTGAAGMNGGSAITEQAVCDGSDVDTTADELCKVGMTGPGGGHIFLVDYNDQYSGLDYLEVAPQSCEGTLKAWSSDTNHSLVALNGWAARAVGRGQTNTTAMMTSYGSYVADTSGAAYFSDSSTCGGKSDWFLGSLGEMKLIYENLQGVGGVDTEPYWSSSEFDAYGAWYQLFYSGNQFDSNKANMYNVRPVRAF